MAALALLGFLAGTLYGCSGESPPASEHPRVKVQRVALEEVPSTATLSGDIQARVQTAQAFRISGKISERLVDVGDHVTRNQVLARLDPQDQRNQVAAAEAQVFAMRSRARLAQVEFERQRTLLPKGYTTQSQYDQALAAMSSANSALATARAQRDDAHKQLSYASLVASADGVITERLAEVGQVVQASMPIFTLAQEGDRDAVFHVQESLLNQGSRDQVIRIALLNDPHVRTTGHVREVSPAISEQSGTVRVKVQLDTVPAAMTLGSAITASLALPERQRVVLPWTALNGTVDAPAVWRVEADNTVSLQPVQIARHVTGQVIIDQGLSPGDRVVTAGGQLLYPGLTVNIVQTAEQAPPLQPAAIDPVSEQGVAP
ncbi:efflux RND transporter periplasmic adaptor subunit [Pseudomonas duriflava]|nr:efflux RND transporter periplasmic adaptor subunit [Pseudomonas duriflava]